MAGAVLADVAIRLPIGTAATALLVLSLVGLLAAAGALRSATQRAAGGLLVLAAAAFVLRASPWVGWITASAVAGLVVLSAADGLRTDQGPTWARSARAWFLSLVTVPAWLGGLLDRVPRVGPGRAGQVLRAGVAAGAVLLVLGGLLASGDAVFGAVLTSVNPGSGLSHLVVTVVFVIPVGAVAVLALRSHGTESDVVAPAAPPVLAGTPDGRRLVVESLAARWATAGLLSLWCGVQLVVVSGGARDVIQRQGLTVAEYTRQGFFQLVAVAALTLAVLNLTHRFLVGPPPAGAAGAAGAGGGAGMSHRAPAVVIGVALMALIAATFSRLAYYLDAFGLTMLRLAVATFLGWLALMTVLSVARSLGVVAGRAWLQSATVLSAAAVAVAYAGANPAAVVARANLSRVGDGTASSERPLDVGYLLRLGPDARGPVADFDWSLVGGRPDSVTRWLCGGGDDPTGSGGNEGSAGYGLLGWNQSRAEVETSDC